MNDNLDEGYDYESEPSPGLSEEEIEEVAERKAGAPKVVHEVIRLEGDAELDRSVLALLMSGLAAGFAISASLVAEAVLTAGLPDASWRNLVIALGYPVGFVIVVMGGLQFFTESTMTALLPVVTYPSARNVLRLLRLWSIVLVANLAGTFLIAALLASQTMLSPEYFAATVEVAHHFTDAGPWRTFLLGVPAGFLVASIAWLMPSSKGQEFWVIFFVTWLISAGGFSHVIASSGGAWLLWLTGESSLWAAIGGFILPALAGNIVGGAGLFAVLAHGQVRDEIETGQVHHNRNRIRVAKKPRVKPPIAGSPDHR